MFDSVSKGHRWQAYRDDRGELEDAEYRPIPIRLQWCKRVPRPDSKTGEEEYEPDSSEIDSVNLQG